MLSLHIACFSAIASLGDKPFSLLYDAGGNVTLAVAPSRACRGAKEMKLILVSILKFDLFRRSSDYTMLAQAQTSVELQQNLPSLLGTCFKNGRTITFVLS